MMFVLPWPPSVNTYWRANRGRVHITREGVSYRSRVAAVVTHHFGSQRLSVTIYVHPPDRRRRDLDNLLKAPLDALQHAGVYEDDEQIDDLRIVRSSQWPSGMLHVHIGLIKP